MKKTVTTTKAMAVSRKQQLLETQRAQISNFKKKDI